jgi:hypothetical protein
MPDHHPATPTVDELLGNLASIFSALGISESAAQDSLTRAFKDVTQSIDKFPDFSLTAEGNYLMSDLIYNWSNHADFVTERGDPSVLKPDGSGPTFEALYEFTAKQHPVGASEIDLDAAKDRLQSHDAMVENPDGTLTLTRTGFPSSTSTRTGANMQLTYINDYIRTCLFNIQNARQSGRFQRIANTRHFPEPMLPTLNALLHEHGMELLHLIDQFLMQSKDELDDPDAPLIEAGVGVYLLVGDSPATTK